MTFKLAVEIEPFSTEKKQQKNVVTDSVMMLRAPVTKCSVTCGHIFMTWRYLLNNNNVIW